jgi:hypothetical protein
MFEAFHPTSAPRLIGCCRGFPQARLLATKTQSHLPGALGQVRQVPVASAQGHMEDSKYACVQVAEIDAVMCGWWTALPEICPPVVDMGSGVDGLRRGAGMHLLISCIELLHKCCFDAAQVCGVRRHARHEVDYVS